MILMYHHVCPTDKIPTAQSPLEGWKYNVSPLDFENQLLAIQQRGFQFVCLDDYVKCLPSLPSKLPQMAVVTFDDGWLDNHIYALPILERLRIPAVFFAVSGNMLGVPEERRMTISQLKELQSAGMTIGAHTRTHPNLAALTPEQVRDELLGSKEDLQNSIGCNVDFLAYPGGRFNIEVVDIAQQVGFHAACSVIAWGNNCQASRFWLYRDVFSDSMNQLSDKMRLNRWTRRVFAWRAQRRVKDMLSSSTSRLNTRTSTVPLNAEGPVAEACSKKPTYDV